MAPSVNVDIDVDDDGGMFNGTIGEGSGSADVRGDDDIAVGMRVVPSAEMVGVTSGDSGNAIAGVINNGPTDRLLSMAVLLLNRALSCWLVADAIIAVVVAAAAAMSAAASDGLIDDGRASVLTLAMLEPPSVPSSSRPSSSHMRVSPNTTLLLSSRSLSPLLWLLLWLFAIVVADGALPPTTTASEGARRSRLDVGGRFSVMSSFTPLSYWLTDQTHQLDSESTLNNQLSPAYGPRRRRVNTRVLAADYC
jgi:hypothetical protein